MGLLKLPSKPDKTCNTTENGMSDQVVELSLTEAIALLKEYSCTDPKPVETGSEKRRLQAAILQVAQGCETKNLGICADNVTQGFTSLENYLRAMGFTPDFSTETSQPNDESVYLKYNCEKQTCYRSYYPESYRGVLLACITEDELGGTYGYFPLDLFET